MNVLAIVISGFSGFILGIGVIVATALISVKSKQKKFQKEVEKRINKNLNERRK